MRFISSPESGRSQVSQVKLVNSRVLINDDWVHGWLMYIDKWRLTDWMSDGIVLYWVCEWVIDVYW